MNSNRYLKKTKFVSFDRTFSAFANHQRPDRLRMLNDRNEEFQIPRGAGLSYAPASFGKDKLIRDMYFAIQEYLECDTKTTANLWTIAQCFEKHSKCSNK